MGDSFKGILHITRVGIFGLVADKSTKMLTKVEMRYEFALTSCMAAQGGLEVWCGAGVGRVVSISTRRDRVLVLQTDYLHSDSAPLVR
jgi:hypothetical protein